MFMGAVFFRTRCIYINSIRKHKTTFTSHNNARVERTVYMRCIRRRRENC